MLQLLSPSTLLLVWTLNCFSATHADSGLNSKYLPSLLICSFWTSATNQKLSLTQPDQNSFDGINYFRKLFVQLWEIICFITLTAQERGKYWNAFNGKVLTFSGTGGRYKMGSLSMGTTCGFPSFLCTLFSKLLCILFLVGLNFLLICFFFKSFHSFVLSLFYLKSSLSSSLCIAILTKRESVTITDPSGKSEKQKNNYL